MKKIKKIFILFLLELVIGMTVFCIYFIIFPDYTTVDSKFVADCFKIILGIKIVFYLPLYILYYSCSPEIKSHSESILIHCGLFTISSLASLIFPWSVFFYSLGMFVSQIFAAGLAYYCTTVLLKEK